MFVKDDLGGAQGGAAAAALALPSVGTIPSFGRAAPAPYRPRHWRERVKYWAEEVDLVPDLGRNIGSLTWWRGLATCAALCFVTVKLAPGLAPLPAMPEPAMTAASYDEIRSQMITPLAYGSNSGRHMGPTDAVSPLATTPERPMIQLFSSVSESGGLSRALARAGVSSADSREVMRALRGDISPGAIDPGTRLDITLGRRPNPKAARPLDALAFRARLDLSVELKRENGALTLHRTPIAVDDTPLRIRGVVSDSLYQAARAAGANPATAQTYLRVIAQQISLDNIGAGDRFDIIVAHRRAADGMAEPGALLYGGLTLASGKKLDMLKWTHEGKEQWFEASGVGKKRDGLAKPVEARRISSGFGMRFHPILGYSRMHQGVDFAASTGTPIHAVTDGVVSYAGRHGGHGNFVKLSHSGGIGTGYAHMSSIAVFAGQRVRRGHVIGYVGSTGISTGPHLHYEVYKNGQTVNPLSIKFQQTALLAGRELKAFRARLDSLKSQARGSGVAVVPADTIKAAAERKIASR
ncbi:MAG: M23 family metallopeptidase [Sphingobium sp.]|nr:M23 family metallopeptidase [Sphingobium sp.]MBP6112144.1 M23 family metallopeptidase [Sphingobium sp.]MBP8671718.1 M23 family metallopeptidase [Sphingobium sp.]MBP9158286.1 M23 family metallopeptidase [Sphingobium sp.]MCC6481147.1 M23 family metallopeptidase [Sphingomonadaceae bacterium]